MLKNRNKTVVAVLVTMLLSCCAFAEINIDWSKPQMLNFEADTMCIVKDKVVIIAENEIKKNNQFYVVGSVKNDKLNVLKKDYFPKSMKIKKRITLKAIPASGKILAMYFSTDNYLYYAVGTLNNSTNSIEWSAPVKTLMRIKGESYDIPPGFAITHDNKVVLFYADSTGYNSYYNWGRLNGNTIVWTKAKAEQFSDLSKGDLPIIIIALSNDRFVTMTTYGDGTYLREGIIQNNKLIWKYPVFIQYSGEGSYLIPLEKLNLMYMGMIMSSSPEEESRPAHTYFKVKSDMGHFPCKMELMNNLPKGIDDVFRVAYSRDSDKLYAIMHYDNNGNSDGCCFSVSEGIDIYDF